MKARRARAHGAVVIRTPEDDAPFFHIPDAGWYVALSWNWGAPLEIPLAELATLLSSAKPGTIVIARRMTADELDRFTAARVDADHETHAHVVPNDNIRWRPPGR